MRYVCSVVACLLVAACASDGGSVMEKVKYDFGIGEKPEGYESGSDRIVARLDTVGKTELKRLNLEGRHGDVEFLQEGPLTGRYYKVVKMYESFRPMEARAITKGSMGERGYLGYIQYTYRMFESEKCNNSSDAEAASANIDTGKTGRETYRYTFGPAGTWDGAEGEMVRE